VSTSAGCRERINISFVLIRRKWPREFDGIDPDWASGEKGKIRIRSRITIMKQRLMPAEEEAAAVNYKCEGPGQGAHVEPLK
jgi:hypothetical protein